MELTLITLYNKLGDTSATRVLSGRYKTPSVYQTNWYELNSNIRLKAIVTVHGDLDDLDSFDSARVKGRKFRIVSKASKSFGRVELGLAV